MHTLLGAAGEERAAMNTMLTNPDVLADYVNEFFGPEGPYPTETAEETSARQQQEARAQFEAEIEAQERNQVPSPTSSVLKWICLLPAVKLPPKMISGVSLVK